MSANDAEQMKKWWFRLSLVLLGTMPDAMREVFKVVWKRKFMSDFEPLSEESPTYKNVRQIIWNKRKKLEEQRHLDDYVKKNLLKPVADMDVTALCTFLLNTNFQGGRLVKFSSALGRQVPNHFLGTLGVVASQHYLSCAETRFLTWENSGTRLSPTAVSRKCPISGSNIT